MRKSPSRMTNNCTSNRSLAKTRQAAQQNPNKQLSISKRSAQCSSSSIALGTYTKNPTKRETPSATKRETPSACKAKNYLAQATIKIPYAFSKPQHTCSPNVMKTPVSERKPPCMTSTSLIANFKTKTKTNT